MVRRRNECKLPDYLKTYLFDFKEYLKCDRRLAVPTVCGYVYGMEKFLEFVMCDPTLVATKDIRDFIKSLDIKQRREATVAGYIGALRAFFNWMQYAHKCESVIDVNFFLNKIVRSKCNNEPTPVPTEEEVNRLRECLLAYKKAYSFNMDIVDYKYLLRDIAAVELFKATGARSGELKGVDLRDIDFEERTLLIKKAKGGKQRISIFGDTARDAVLEYVNVWNIGPDQPLFFFTRFNIFNQIIKKWAVRSGINPEIRPHSFRHYHVTKAQRDGVPTVMVANQVGHVNLSTTLRYTHLDTIDRRRKYQISELQN